VVTIEQINRINELARKAKAGALSAAEKAEQAELRRLYIESFRENLKAELDNIEIVDPDDPRLKRESAFN